MKRQWTEQEINEWYAKQPWLRGTNFLPSDCINRLDMWQSFGREEHLKTAETELKLSEETGFNTVRLWCNFDVYYKEPEEFMQTLESYISLCAKYHHSVMLVLAYEEDLPYGDKFVAKELGAQKEYYNHFNRDYELQDKLMAEHAYKHYTEYPEIKPIFMEMAERVVKSTAPTTGFWLGISKTNRAPPSANVRFRCCASCSRSSARSIPCSRWRRTCTGACAKTEN